MRFASEKMLGADQLMNQAIFLGTYPGLTEAMIDREVSVIKDFVKERLLKTQNRST